MLEELEILMDSAEGLNMEVREMFTLALGIMLVLRYTGLVAWRCGQVTSDLVIAVCTQLLLSIILGGSLWWLVGHGIAHGDGLLFGTTGYIPTLDREKFEAVWFIELFVAVTALDGVQSLVIGRVNFVQYLIIATFLMGFSIPVAFHSVWGRTSWLRPGSENVLLAGFFDPSGGITAALFSGGSAIACAVTIGRRNFKTATDAASQQRALEGHNYFFQATGFLMAWMILYAQVSNGVLQDTVKIGNIGNSLLFLIVSSSFGSIASLLCSLDINRHYKLSSVVNGIAASLNASCSACHCVPVSWAPLVGMLSACIYFGVRKGLDKARVDDPFLVLSSTFAPAVWGCIAAALFADKRYFTTSHVGEGLFRDGNSDALFSHILGIIVISGWGFLSMLICTKLLVSIADLTEDASDLIDHGGCYCDVAGMFDKDADKEPLLDREYTSASFCAASEFAPPTVRSQSVIEEEKASKLSQSGLDVSFHQFEPEFENELLQKRNIKLQVFRWVAYLVVISTSMGCSLAQPDEAGESIISNSDITTELSHVIGNITLQISDAKGDMNTVWVLLCGIIVFSMQLGFCYIESGGVRSSSVINITFKNIGDCAIGSMCWWLTGYGMSYADGGIFFTSTTDLFAMSPIPGSEDGGRLAHFFLSFTYMTTAVTIISGAVAERITLPAYYMIVAAISSFFYPLVVRTIWSEYGFASPWSTNRIGSGCLDFAGSIVIHMYGGCCALVMASIIGHRTLINGIDLFSDAGQEIVAGHNKFQTAAGTLLLWFAWFAFNAGSVVQISDGGSIVAANAIVCTLLAASTAGMSGLATSRFFFGYYDVGHVCNCVLTGLVSITAGCAYMSPVYAPPIGVIACVVYSCVRLLRIRLRIDDVIDAGAVHFGGGVWGGISTGLFSDCERIRIAVGDSDITNCGLFVGGGWTLLGVQLAAILSVIGWGFLTSSILSFIITQTVGLRVDPFFEIHGIDQSEHLAHSYDYIERIQAERTRAVEAQEVAEKVTQAMSLFNLEDAEGVIQASRARHDCELYQYFDRLLGNLKLYKPYLPDTLFQDVGEFGSENGSDSDESSAKETHIGTSAHVTSVATTAMVGSKLATGLNRHMKSTVLHARLVEDHEHITIPERVAKYTLVIGLFEDLVKESRGCLMKVEGNQLMAVWGISSFVAMSGYVATRISLAALAKYKSITMGDEKPNPEMPLSGLSVDDKCMLFVAIAGGNVLSGNIGTSTTRSSIIHGAPVAQVEVLSHVAAYLRCRLVIDRITSQYASNYYDFRPVDVISGNHFSFSHEIYEIVSVKKSMKQDNREWMYELQQTEKEKSNVNEDYIEAFKLMRGADYKSAVNSLVSHLERTPTDTGGQRLLVIAQNLEFDSRYKPCKFRRYIHSPPFSLYPGERLPHETIRDIVVSVISVLAITVTTLNTSHSPIRKHNKVAILNNQSSLLDNVPADGTPAWGNE